MQLMANTLWAYATCEVLDLRVLAAAKDAVLSKRVWTLQVRIQKGVRRPA